MTLRLQGTRYNGRFTNDLNPRDDYGRANTDNRHAFMTRMSITPFGGLTTGAIVRYC